jgi:transaldolase/glucose-6-phosphate isomerase
LEVSPKLARDTDGTIVEARRLWTAVGRPNLMIKVPATDEGMPAITQLISNGINVNVTLLFSQEMYRKAAEAYLSGLEQLSGKQASLQGIASVTSFFVSRIDAEVEKAASALLKTEENADKNEHIQHLLGKVAIANAKIAYQQYQTILSGSRWENLAGQGAEPQRLLWASTGTKNPAYSDVLYIEELIGPDTVNTAPPATLDAFRDHGRVRTSLQEDVAEADAVLRQMEKVGISLDKITELLLENGIKLFADAYDTLIDSIALKVSEYKLEEQES